MKRFLLLPLLFCFPLMAQATRVRCEFMRPDGRHTAGGTAYLINKKELLTCAHVVDSGGEVFVEGKAGWIRCKIEKISGAYDLALLKAAVDIEPLGAGAENPSGLCALCSNLGRPIEKMKVTLAAPTAQIPGADHGASGSPILKDKKLVGIISGLVVGFVVYVPADKIERFLK